MITRTNFNFEVNSTKHAQVLPPTHIIKHLALEIYSSEQHAATVIKKMLRMLVSSTNMRHIEL